MSSFLPSMSLWCRMVETASALAFFEEAEAKDLEVEYIELVRSGFSKSLALARADEGSRLAEASAPPEGVPAGRRRRGRSDFLVLLVLVVDVLVLFSDMFQQHVLIVPLIQFIYDFWTFPLCSRDRCVVRWCRKLRLSPQLQSIEGRRYSFRAADAVPHGPVY